MAPEVEREETYGLPADIFSLGAMGFEMFYVLQHGEDFYEDMNLFNGLDVLRAPITAEPQQMPERPEACADDATWDLLCSCMAADPTVRPTFAEAARVLGAIMAASNSQLADWLQ